MARNRSKNKRVAAKFSTKSTTLRIAQKRQLEGKSLTKEHRKALKQAEAVSDLKAGQSVAGMAAISDAFIFGVEAIAKKDSIRSGRKIRGQNLVTTAARLEEGAEDVIESGKEQAREISKQGSQDASSLRARLAGQGIQVDFGTGAEGVEDILRVSGEDASAIKMNAFKRAHNLNLQASDLKSQAVVDRIASKKEEDDTMLTGGLNALRSVNQGVQATDGFSAFNFTR